jgi:hypothetical protein
MSLSAPQVAALAAYFFSAAHAPPKGKPCAVAELTGGATQSTTRGVKL